MQHFKIQTHQETMEQFRIRNQQELENQLIQLRALSKTRPLDTSIQGHIKTYEDCLIKNYPDSKVLNPAVLDYDEAKLRLNHEAKLCLNHEAKLCLDKKAEPQQATSKPVKKSKKAEASITDPVKKGKKAQASTTEPVKKKKKSISATIKKLVWNVNIGEEIGKTKCLCCKSTDITQMSFNCGHIIAEADGGETIVLNLKPICQNCNSSMGTKNMNEFMRSLN